MKTVSSELRTGSLAVCWRVVRQDGEIILGTEHDRPITIPTGSLAGTYLADAGITGSDVRSASDLSADNLEVDAFTPADVSILGLRAVDVEAGLYDAATVTLFLANWSKPSATPLVIRRGTLGQITRTSEGEFRTELRGIAQKLAQNFIRTYGITCDAELYDSRCKVVRASFTYEGVVTTVTSRKVFDIDFGTSALDTGFLDGGELLFTSGNNDGYRMEIHTFDTSGVTLFQAMARDVQVGDTLEAYAGCDRTKDSCKLKFSNLPNFRGHGLHVPGMMEVLKVGGQGA